jgi:hypothetical protein
LQVMPSSRFLAMAKGVDCEGLDPEHLKPHGTARPRSIEARGEARRPHHRHCRISKGLIPWLMAG